MTSNRERLNDLCSLSLVCKTFRPIAQAALYNKVIIRAEGRARLLRDTMTRDNEDCQMLKGSTFAQMVNSISWMMFSNTSSPALLATIINLARPHSLSLGHGFFRASSSEVSELTDALYSLNDTVTSFTFGRFDTGAGHTSSDYISHHLSQWHNLMRLDLWNVAFVKHVAGAYPLLANIQWLKYDKPAFKLRHLGVHWISHDKEEHWQLHQHDWLTWLLSNSSTSLRSLKLTGLDEALPEETLDYLISMSSELQDLYISNYNGPQLLADILLHRAHNLYTLTLGGDYAMMNVEDGSTMPTLATSSALDNKDNLRCLEIHDLLLFDRMEILDRLKQGKLPALRQITLLNASRVYLPVQKLVLYCRGTDISVVVRPYG
jgi:hypothetical protein